MSGAAAALPVALLLLLALIAGAAGAHQAGPRPPKRWGGPWPSAGHVGLLCADNGTFSGAGELGVVRAEMTGSSPLDLPECQSAVRGAVRGVPVVLVTTGINAEAAAVCTAAVLRMHARGALGVAGGAARGGGEPALRLRLLAWTGTSGWSPNAGGWPTGSSCSAGDRVAAPRLALGSVCVGAAGMALDAHFSTPGTVAGGGGAAEGDCGPLPGGAALAYDAAVFGQTRYAVDRAAAAAVFKVAADMAAAGSGGGRGMPVMPAELRGLAGRWWAAQGNQLSPNRQRPPARRRRGPVLPLPVGDVPTAPAAFGPSHCLEASTHVLWTGGRTDAFCRNQTSQWLQQAFGAGAGGASTPCVAAMEAAGVLRAYAVARPADGRPPLVVMRGMSNYDQLPQRWAGGAWRQWAGYAPPGQRDALVRAGYHYAVATTNAVLLAFLATMGS